ncbi:hypothetical protein BGZ75_005045 [Mortierella antarctica]|nr:hypothetical protein BGZ75_005045 [Mortierella antarctica]
MDEKEKVAVPLVPAGRAQSVIEAFESQSEDLGWTGSNFSRAGSIVSSPCSDHEGLGATSSCSSVVSIAELIARGHSSRAGSALAEQLMEHINHICRDEGYPIVVENSPTLGNHALAARDIPQGEGLLRAIPYAAEVFDNYKKRMCHICLLYHNRGSFMFRCQDCDQVYFCSEACKSIAMDPAVGAHAKICRTLRKLATWNSDRHTKSIIKLLLQVLMNHWRERQGMSTAYKSRKLLQELQEEQKQQQQQQQQQQQKKNKTDQETGSDMPSRLDLAVDNHGEEDSRDMQLATDLDRQLSLKEVSVPVDALVVSKKEQQQQNRIQEPVENDFYDVLRLQSHFEDWDDEDTKDWNKQSQTVLSLLEMSGLTEMAIAPGGELKTITSLDVKKLISALESNAFGMFDRTKKKPVCFGRAIYPVASFFNHSCECNATAVQADGSEEQVSGADVLETLDLEKNKASDDREARSVTNKDPPTQESLTLATPITSAPSAPPFDSATASCSDSCDATETSTTEEPTTETTTDPYDSRMGEFRMMTFFAISDIPKGQDITISYIDTEMPLHARRLALLSDYHFHCCCVRCLREERKEDKSSSSSSSKKGGGGKGKKEKKVGKTRK